LPALRDVDFIVACPLARGSMGYRGIAEQDVYDVLAEVKRRYPVDEDRVYLTGASMGGGGALWLALTRPDVWAAVALVSPAVIPGSDELAANALNVPLRIFHGDQDPVTPVEASRNWQRTLLGLGAQVDYVEYPGVRHNAWDPAYRNGAIFDWFGKFQRNQSPDHVRFATRSYRYNRAWWLRIDGLTPGILASIDAVRTGTAIRIQTRNIDAFTISAEPGRAPVATVTIDGAAVRIRPARTVTFTKTTGWAAAAYTPAGKRPGAEGPIAEAAAGRHIYVYGSIGVRTADELSVRRKIAETASAWSSLRARVNLKPRVKADSEISPEDIDTADLILFGTRETNSVIARLAPTLPLALNAGAADYGLLFIAPAGKHYALVSSGLPWWTGADEADRGGYQYAPEPYRLLGTFGEYILFKGSLANVLAEGRFDNNWKLPAEAAAKIAATGTVTLR
jgi:putative esterase